MGLIDAMLIFQAARTIGSAVVWALMVVVLWRGAKCLGIVLRLSNTRRVCEKCGTWYMSPNRRFCGDCGGKITKAA